MKNQTIVDTITIIFLLLFTYTAFSKLFNIASFQSVLQRSPLLNNHAVFVSWIIPIVELAICVLLVIPSMKMKGLISTSILMLLFTGYIYYMLRFSSRLPCSCGGIISSLSWRQHLALNILLLTLSVTAIVIKPLRHSASSEKLDF